MKKLSLIAFALLLAGAGCLGGSTQVDNSPDAVMDETEANIVVDSPTAGDSVTSPIEMTGRARVFENVVDYAIKTEDGDVLASGFFTADAPDVGKFGDFNERVFLPSTSGDSIILEVFSTSARDGSVQDLVRIPLTLTDTGTSSVEAYFVDSAIAATEDCTAVDFEKRTAHKTVNVAELALVELLKGPTSSWAVTEIPEGTKLNSITIRDGVADVDFYSPNPARWSGGSCHTTAIRAQIEQTLLQFPTVDSVEISVNGDSHNILIP